jgi:hypothetical protein
MPTAPLLTACSVLALLLGPAKTTDGRIEHLLFAVVMPNGYVVLPTVTTPNGSSAESNGMRLDWSRWMRS